jgi:hypothetical protein
MDLKKEVFAKLDGICKPDAILCLNTSALSIDAVSFIRYCSPRLVVYTCQVWFLMVIGFFSLLMEKCKNKLYRM